MKKVLVLYQVLCLFWCFGSFCFAKKSKQDQPRNSSEEMPYVKEYYQEPFGTIKIMKANLARCNIQIGIPDCRCTKTIRLPKCPTDTHDIDKYLKYMPNSHCGRMATLRGPRQLVSDSIYSSVQCYLLVKYLIDLRD